MNVDPAQQQQTAACSDTGCGRLCAGRWLLLLALATAGACIAGFLFFRGSIQGASVPGCGPGSPCDQVLSSRWSSVLGIPVSALAAGMHLLSAIVVIAAWRTRCAGLRAWAWSWLSFAAFSTVLAAAWFTFLQLGVLKAVCPWCMTEHGVGVAFALAVLGWSPIYRTSTAAQFPAPLRLLLPTLALAAVTGMMAIQRWSSADQTQVTRFATGPDFDTGPGPDRQISILERRVRLSPRQHPLIGSPDAAFVLVSLFDYTCPHCRKMHEHLAAARERFGDDQIAIVAMPVPLDADCNPHVEHTESRHEYACELASLALAVWKADASQFPAFDRWLFEPEHPPTPAQALRKAQDLVGAEALKQALTGPSVAQQIEGAIKLYELTGKGVIPKVIVKGLIIAGQPGESARLFELFEDELGMTPRAGAAQSLQSPAPAAQSTTPPTEVLPESTPAPEQVTP